MNGSNLHTGSGSRDSLRCSKQTQANEAEMRRQKYGPIRPMYEPSFVEKLFGWR